MAQSIYTNLLFVDRSFTLQTLNRPTSAAPLANTSPRPTVSEKNVSNSQPYLRRQRKTPHHAHAVRIELEETIAAVASMA